jgi:hypothetical protein
MKTDLVAFARAGEETLEGDSTSAKPEEKKGSASAGARLTEIGLRAELFHDERRDAYAAVLENDVRRIVRVKSKSFRDWLAYSYYGETGKAANGEALAAATNVCSSKALFEGKRYTLEVRFARPSPGEVFIDLADERWRAVRVTAEGWKVVQKSPILFRRFSHQAALPEPERGGDLRRVLNFLNVRRDDERILLLAWLLAAPLADIPRPVLDLYGPQGSAKTTAALVLKKLVDPSAVANLVVGRDTGELAQALDHHAVPFYDNLTKLQGWQSDMFCRAVTGGGFSKRELYSDADDVIFGFRRPILLTGINVPSAAPDLLERLLLVGLDRVTPEFRREESALWREFEAERPKLFGGLLDALAETLRIYPSIALAELPRMADFARWGSAAAEALGYGHQAFVHAYQRNVSGITDEVLDSDAVAVAVRVFATEREKWAGAVSELLSEINTGQTDSILKSADWPKDASRLSRRLRVLQTSLAEVGVLVGFPDKKTSGGLKAVELRFLPPVAPGIPSGFAESGLHPGSYAGASEKPTPDLAPAGLVNRVGRSGDSGATGAIFPGSTAALGADASAIQNQCGSCLAWRPSDLVQLDLWSRIYLCGECRHRSTGRKQEITGTPAAPQTKESGLLTEGNRR